jgi:hypothetical protein
MDQAIIKPRAYRKRTADNMQTVGGETGLPNGSNSFLASSFVVFTQGTTVLTSNNTAPSDGDQVSIGGQVYTFKTTLTPTVGQVLINSTADAALLNLARAINGTGTPGTDYATGTPVNPYVSSSASVTSHTITLTGLTAYVTNVALSTPVGTTLSFTAATLGNAGLHQIATAAVLTCGLCIDPSHLPGVINPPYAFFADNHWPIDPHGVQFLINIGTVSAGSAVVGQANSAKQISNVTVGTSYGVAVATAGTYAGYEFLDPTNTSNLLFTVVGIPSLRGVAPQGAPEGQTAATYNGIVQVELVSTTIQTLS